jgi:lipopolysaccharide transport system ATP-binding protein
MESIIEVKNIWKQYMIGGKQESYLSLRDSLYQMGKQLLKGNKEIFWALEDISFDVAAGECLGIIGRNGAGKSTLLKILSRITPPSKGEITMRGRVASLLEVGTGFHPELTGRENIFLNGSILGMKNAEIKQAFDEIIDFSGVEQFLDTSLKHYSSGMQLRLAFSVAAHLNPEILLIDEVLAVGDAAFQKKCLGKMDEVSKSGRTIIFVSHDLGAVKQLCSRSILLEKGKKVADGDTDDIVNQYLQGQNDLGHSWKIDGISSKDIEIIAAQLNMNQQGNRSNIDIQFSLHSSISSSPAFVAFNIHTAYGNSIMQAIPSEKKLIEIDGKNKNISSKIQVEGLIPGRYYISIWIGSDYTNTYDWKKEILSFSIETSPIKGRTFKHDSLHGFIVPHSEIVNIKTI